jgi:DNA-binding NarL/FixJ family response regulator
MVHVLPSIVIIDDDPSFLAAVRLLLEAEGFAVVGEALTGGDGVAAAARLRPDLVLVDVHLPDIDGFEVVARLAAESVPPPVVLTSTRAAEDFGGLIETSGARAFISKGEISGSALSAFLRAPVPP